MAAGSEDMPTALSFLLTLLAKGYERRKSSTLDILLSPLAFIVVCMHVDVKVAMAERHLCDLLRCMMGEFPRNRHRITCITFLSLRMRRQDASFFEMHAAAEFCFVQLVLPPAYLPPAPIGGVDRTGAHQEF